MRWTSKGDNASGQMVSTYASHPGATYDIYVKSWDGAVGAQPETFVFADVAPPLANAVVALADDGSYVLTWVIANQPHVQRFDLAGAEGPSPSAWLEWLVAAPIGFGAGLFGIYQLLIAQRSVEAKRAPVWMVAWCLPFLAPIVAGSPELAPISPYLIPAGALGLADWLNRQGSSSREARLGTVVALAQIGLTAALVLTR